MYEKCTHEFNRSGIVEKVLRELVGVLLLDDLLARLDDMTAVFDQRPTVGRKLALVDSDISIRESCQQLVYPYFTCEKKRNLRGMGQQPVERLFDLLWTGLTLLVDGSTPYVYIYTNLVAGSLARVEGFDDAIEFKFPIDVLAERETGS
jgi:hypothetical protein